ncbi:unnamed protein product [Paramecium sonneborni]|uniref:Uncharacterized protein n=1 Tax=Paramecium sonneborni TaxID=65129 RepID=A0A8S1RMX7_9CILI|nr:unnamed protein product [Paramecium sonneborni]
MTSNDIDFLEKYQLQSQDQALSTLVKGSQEYTYYTLLKSLNEQNTKLNEEQETQLKNLKSQSENFQNIEFRSLILEFESLLKESDIKENQIKKQKIMQIINDKFLHLQFNKQIPKENQFEFNQNEQTEDQSGIRQYKSKLDPKNVSLNTYLQKSYQNQDLYGFSVYALRQLEFEQIIKCNDEWIYNYLQILTNSRALEGLDFIIPLFQRLLKGQFQLEFIFTSLSLQQMEELQKVYDELKNNLSFIKIYYSKRFSPNQFFKQDHNIQNEYLQEIYEWQKTLPKQFQFQELILINQLNLNAKQRNYDFNLFIQYLKRPLKHFQGFNENLKDSLKNNQLLFNPISVPINHDQIIYQNLEYFIEKDIELTQLENYFEEHYLKKTKALLYLQQGKEVPNINQILTENEIQKLYNEKYIEFDESNQINKFKHGEQVKLIFSLKNIPQLSIKVFQINTLNYYLQEGSQNFLNLNLKGLIPNNEIIIDFQQDFSPTLKKVQEIEFPEITQKERGLFIIDFYGNGISSRALIQKGKLQLRQKKIVSSGHCFEILDENLQICCSDKTGIWVDKQFYPIDKQRKEILIPFGRTQQEQNAIIYHEGFSNLQSIKIEQESYQFKCTGIVAEESLIIGNQAKILLFPKLLGNQNAISLKLLQNITIQAQILNEELNPNVFTFDNVKFEDQKPYEIDIPIIKFQLISIQITCQIKSMTNKNQIIDLKDCYSIIQQEALDTEQFNNQYLQYTEKEGYSIYVLGIGGEPKKNVKLELSFQINHYKSYTEILQTDENGRIYLGNLENVVQLSSEPIDSESINMNVRNWMISYLDVENIPNNLSVLVGQKITLPLCVERDKIILYKIYEGQVIEYFSQLLVLEKNQLSFTLTVPGQYELIILAYKESQIVKIEVFEGQQKLDSNMFISKQKLIIDQQLNNLISIHSVEKVEGIQSTKITGQISSNRPATLFVICESFYTQPYLIIQQIKQILSPAKKEEFHVFYTQFQSLTNTEISDEEQYVENRKKQETFIGNTLEKPQLLLKRQYIQECVNETEQLKNEKQQQAQKNILQYQNQKKSYWQSDELQNMMPLFCKLDFLKQPGKLIILQPNQSSKEQEDQEFSFEIPNCYSQIMIFALNDYNYAFQEISLNSCGISTRSLEHQTILKKDKCYTTSRNSQVVKKEESIYINDVTATKMKIIDSLEKVYRELISLNKNGKNLRDKDLQNWEFLIQWNIKTLEQKHQIYDEFQSDELNLFLYFKDSPFFEVYVLNYIKNKIEKNLIDHFLCQNDTELQRYLSTYIFNNLNLIEQILLLIYFQEIKKNKIQAQQIYSYMQQNYDKLTVDQDLNQRLFDTILTSQEAEELTNTNNTNINNNQIGLSKIATGSLLNPPPPPSFNPFGESYSGGAPPPQLPGGYPPYTPPQHSSGFSFKPTTSTSINDLKSNIAMRFTNLNEEKCQEKSLYKKNLQKYNSYEDEEHYNQQRNVYIQNYKNVEKTKEYGERHSYYYKDQKIPIKLNKFFLELAQFSLNQGILNTSSSFISPQIIHYTTFSEFVFILTVLDLPFQNLKQNYFPYQEKGMQIVAESNLIYYSKDIKEVDIELRNDILITQLFFDEQNKKQEFLTSQEYLTNHIYGSLIIVSNFSNISINAQIFIEIPNGAIPVKSLFYSKSINISCQPLSTERYSYYWYFPKEGTFNIHPACLTILDKVVAVSKPQSFNVVNVKGNPNLEVIEDILLTGDKTSILAFLETKNIFDEKVFKSTQIVNLYEDRDFYMKVLKIYRNKKFQDAEILKFAVYHADFEGLKEFFAQRHILDQFNSIKYFKCSLFEISNMKMVEYYPLITKRVHKLKTDEQGILNIELRKQYKDYLMYLIEKPNHSVSDKLGLSYYLLLQERITEAIQVFNQIQLPLNEGNSELQYDYFQAYFDFYVGYPNFQDARRICEKYLNYSVIYWRNLFYEIANLLAEFDGDEDQKELEILNNTFNYQQKQLATKEETLSCDIKGTKLIITYSNLQQVTIMFYKFNLEVLFSIDPFLLSKKKDFSITTPNHEFNVTLDHQKEGEIYKQEIEIPQHLQRDNLYIQINGVNKKVFLNYQSNGLIVNIMENSGQLRVFDLNGLQLSKVYVKVYVKETTGKSYFYKDGYTDLRGRFDYAFLNSDEILQDKTFAILISDQQNGTVVKEVQTPSTIGKYEGNIKLVSKLWQQKAENQKQNQNNKINV